VLGTGFVQAARQATFRLPKPMERQLRRCYPAVLAASGADLALAHWRGTAAGGVQANLLVAGPEPWSAYLAQRLFCGPAAREALGSFKPWTLERVLRHESRPADLTVIRVDHASARLFFRQQYLRVPAWVALRCRPADAHILARRHTALDRDLRNIRHWGLSTEITEGDGNFDYFYDKMYLPFMTQRHGDSAYVRDSRWCRQSLRHGGFVWVLQDGQRVGGCLFERHGRTLELCVVGLLNGNPELKRQGAISALYMRAVEQARIEGCEWAGFGAVRPSLTDGLLRFKAKWDSSLCASLTNSYSFLVRWERWNPAVEALLSSTPLIYSAAGGFSAVAVLARPGPAEQSDLQSLRRMLWVNGLSRLTIVSPAGFAKGLTPPPDTRLEVPGQDGRLLPESL
jgi:hypothetical protein